MKLKLLTTDQGLLKWRSLDRKKQEILKALNASPSADFTDFDVEAVEVTAELNSRGRISHSWLDRLFAVWFKRGYDFVGLHYSKKGWLALGLPETLRGANPIDSDVVGEFYMWADEDTTRRYTRGGSRLNQFIQVLLHEICHEYYRGAGLPDPTHDHHYTEGEIRSLVATLDWTLYRPKLQEFRQAEGLLMKLLRLFIKKLQGQVADLQSRVRPTTLTPVVQRKADAIVAEMKRRGHAVRIVEGYRTFERQTELYNQGRTTAGAIVTNAKAGESLHNYGVAVDFVFRREGYNASSTLWALLGKVGKDQGFTWGGDWQGFVDRPHFELKQGYTTQEFKEGKVDYTKFN